MMIPLILLAFSGVSAELVLDGLDKPTGIAWADSKRMMVTEQNSGQVRLVLKGTLKPKPFLDLSTKAADTSWHGEAGLLGIAFHPQYKKNGFFFVHYVDVEGATVIERYRAVKKNRAKKKGTQVLRFERTDRGHYGGALTFGPDGMLYAFIGAAWRGLPQYLDNPFGKIWRIDPETFEREIVAYGMRNPWQGAFDADGNLWWGDVGNDCFEELNRVTLADLYGETPLNFGWGYLFDGTGSSTTAEGFHCAGVDGLSCANAAATFCGLDDPRFVPPIHEYGRTDGRTIIGGRVSGDTYYFADFFQRMWAMDTATLAVTDISAETGRHFVSAFGQDGQGRVYFTDYVAGQVYRLTD